MGLGQRLPDLLCPLNNSIGGVVKSVKVTSIIIVAITSYPDCDV